MPYLPIIIVFAQKYDRKAGIEPFWRRCCRIRSHFNRLDHHVVVLVYLGIPLGPGATTVYG